MILEMATNGTERMKLDDDTKQDVYGNDWSGLYDLVSIAANSTETERTQAENEIVATLDPVTSDFDLGTMIDIYTDDFKLLHSIYY
jgi:hypothetical protein